MFGMKFLSVKNFQEMLIKLTFWHFIAALFCFYLLNKEVQFFTDVFDGLIITLWKIKFPVLLVIFAIVWAGFFSHVLKLHDRISDVFGIRSRYDQKYILLPLANGILDRPSKELKLKIKSQRHNAMSNMFYKFASSTDTEPLVGKHNIHQALTTFSWYWLLLEITFTSFVTGITILIFNCQFSFLAFGLSGFCLLLSFLIIPELHKYTNSQIQRIIENNEASKSVRDYLNAL